MSFESSDQKLKEFREEEEKLVQTVDPDLRLNLLTELGTRAYWKSNEHIGEKRRSWLEKAYNYLKDANKIDSSDQDVLRILAASTGRLAEESDVRNKIRLGFEFKEYLDQAMAGDSETDPDHTFELCHMRGRLAYTVLILSRVERLIARTFGVVPVVTIEEAVADLKKAAQLHPNEVENDLFVAKVLILKGDTDEAVVYLKKVASSKVEVAVEQEYIDEAKKLLQSLK